MQVQNLFIFFSIFWKIIDFQSYEQQVPGIDHPITMIPIKGGSFQMGSNESADTQPVHEVAVNDFWMATYEVNWDQYEAFVFGEIQKNLVDKEKLNDLGIDGITGATTPYVEMSFGMGKDGYPAVNVTQYAALMYCKWLSASTGIFYRLPTEAEWEFACKAGTMKDFDGILGESAVFAGNNEGKYAKSGTKTPNKSGLFDMLGNVSEWTMDQYDPEFYKQSLKSNPWNKPSELYPRTTRGGSWKDDADGCSCSSRNPSNPNWKLRDPQFPKSLYWHTNAPFVGFRIVRPRIQPSKEEISKYWLDPIEDFN